MAESTHGVKSPLLTESTEILIAIGAATAANCIPCFEHLYEMAVSMGLNSEQIRHAADIAAKVKTGANGAIFGCITELVGEKPGGTEPLARAAAGCSCR